MVPQRGQASDATRTISALCSWLALLRWTAVHLPEQRQEVRDRAYRAELRLAFPATLHALRGRGVETDARELNLELVRVAR